MSHTQKVGVIDGPVSYSKAQIHVNERKFKIAVDSSLVVEEMINLAASIVDMLMDRSDQQVMKLDILSIQHQLSKREKEALEQALNEKGFSIKEFQLLFPETSKRTLQRELKYLLETGLLKAEGSTNDRRYLINV